VPPFISWPAGFVIPLPKLSRYLLDPNGSGASKARFLLGHGFTQDEPHVLAQELFQHTTLANFTGVRIVPHGFNMGFRGPIDTPNGAQPCIRSYWHVSSGSAAGEASFVTAYPN
jgi:hypothetical protein